MHLSKYYGRFTVQTQPKMLYRQSAGAKKTLLPPQGQPIQRPVHNRSYYGMFWIKSVALLVTITPVLLVVW